MKRLLLFSLLLNCLMLPAQQREAIWPEGRMPDAQAGQIAAMTDEAEAPHPLSGMVRRAGPFRAERRVHDPDFGRFL